MTKDLQGREFYSDFNGLLHEIAYESGVFDGAFKEEWPDKFDAWLQEQEPHQIVEWAEQHVKNLASFRGKKEGHD